VPKKSSPLETYTSTEQVRERFAMGLWDIFEMDDSWDGWTVGMDEQLGWMDSWDG
jgi:hypothetical protein